MKEEKTVSRKFPYRTLIGAVLLVIIVVAVVIAIWPKQTDGIEIDGCDYPPNPIIGSKADLKLYINKNLGFFKGTGEPLVLDFVPDQGRELPTIKVEINDEGKYGRSYFTDDWTVPKPVYNWHDGKYDVKALVQEVGQWNEMIAAKFGALNDVLNVSSSPTRLESPITDFPDFEQLEFKGQTNHEYLQPFLTAMNQLAGQERAKHRNGDPA